ncbi:MAG: hypothetical protein KF847_08230 [Pirellulales bacterium]|nr:hypothetical protein [Pirellulales bacterium]
MTRPFCVPTVLRMVPNWLLEKFFEKLEHSDFDPKWKNLKEREIDPILDYLEELERNRLDDVESGLHSISDLASDAGLSVLMEAGKVCGVPNLGSLVPDELSVWGQSAWLWLNYRDVFDKAQIIYKIEHMSWWRKRNDLPEIDPDTSDEAIATFARDISSLLKASGRGKDCTVECLVRGSIHYFFAYPDDYVKSVLAHDADGVLSPELLRETLLLVFAYNQSDGSLELFAKGLNKAAKEQLERIFVDDVLHWSLGEYDPDAAYELNQLKDPLFDLTPDAADQIRIRIRKMRLSGNGRRVLIEIDDDDPLDSIYKAIEECLNLGASPLSEWNATLVNFSFEFLPLDGRKPGRQSFDVAFPRSCSLRNARPERIEIIQKYLKRWKIDLAESIDPPAIAMGR